MTSTVRREIQASCPPALQVKLAHKGHPTEMTTRPSPTGKGGRASGVKQSYRA